MSKKEEDYTPQEIQAELMELTLKAGRRLMHDFAHLLNEVDADTSKIYRERLKVWKSIFYADNGNKNYRAELHHDISHLNIKLMVAYDKLRAAGIDPDADLPF